MRCLFLDDMPDRVQTFTEVFGEHPVAVNAKEAIEKLDGEEVFELVCLDHDLDTSHYRHYFAGHNAENYGPIPTGLKVARHIVALPKEKQPKYVWLHSHNEIGVKAMSRALEDTGIQIIISPFNHLTCEGVHGWLLKNAV